MKYAVFAAMLALLVLLASCSSSGGETRPEGKAEDTSAAKEETDSEGDSMTDRFDFSQFPNVTITGIDLSSLDESQLSLLYAQARYSQAMTDTDIDTLREMVPEDQIFVHMSGLRQTREEYFADIADGKLRYYSVEIADPVIAVDGDTGSITCTNVLHANAYGAEGFYRMNGTHTFVLRDGAWMTESR